MIPFSQKKSRMVVGKNRIPWDDPLCESISGLTWNGPFYEILNTPLSIIKGFPFMVSNLEYKAVGEH